jgi:hypothetical protein
LEADDHHVSATAIYRDTSLEGVLSWADPASVRDTGLVAIDKYAGAGGMSTAAEAAGIRVGTGMNHWTEAIRVYAAHVQTRLRAGDARQPRVHDLLAGA